QAREAALAIAQLSTEGKNALLRAMADALEADAAAILGANARDVEAAAAKGVGSAMQDRLRLDEKRLKGVADALREVAGLPDPVAQVDRKSTRLNSSHVKISYAVFCLKKKKPSPQSAGCAAKRPPA